MTEKEWWEPNQWVDYFNERANPEIDPSQDDDDNNNNGNGGGGGAGDDGNPGGDGPGGGGPGGGGSGKDGPDDDGPGGGGPDGGGDHDGPDDDPHTPVLGLHGGPPPPGNVRLAADEQARLETARNNFYARYLDEHEHEQEQGEDSHDLGSGLEDRDEGYEGYEGYEDHDGYEGHDGHEGRDGEAPGPTLGDGGGDQGRGD